MTAPAVSRRKGSEWRSSNASRARIRPRSSGCRSSGSRGPCAARATICPEAPRAAARAARAELIEHRGEIRRQRRVDAERPAALRPYEAQAVRVQEHALEATCTQLLVELRVTVLLVP